MSSVRSEGRQSFCYGTASSKLLNGFTLVTVFLESLINPRLDAQIKIDIVYSCVECYAISCTSVVDVSFVNRKTRRAIDFRTK